MKRVSKFISSMMFLGLSFSVVGALADTTDNKSLNVVNLNQASAEQLSSLKGVGAKRAAAIVAYRQSHGKFQHVDDLASVPGISKHLLDKISAQNEHRMVTS